MSRKSVKNKKTITLLKEDSTDQDERHLEDLIVATLSLDQDRAEKSLNTLLSLGYDLNDIYSIVYNEIEAEYSELNSQTIQEQTALGGNSSSAHILRAKVAELIELAQEYDRVGQQARSLEALKVAQRAAAANDPEQGLDIIKVYDARQKFGDIRRGVEMLHRDNIVGYPEAQQAGFANAGRVVLNLLKKLFGKAKSKRPNRSKSTRRKKRFRNRKKGKRRGFNRKPPGVPPGTTIRGLSMGLLRSKALWSAVTTAIFFEDLLDIAGMVHDYGKASKAQFERNNLYGGSKTRMAVQDIDISPPANAEVEKFIKRYVSFYSFWDAKSVQREYPTEGDDVVSAEEIDNSGYSGTNLNKNFTPWTVPDKLLGVLSSPSLINEYIGTMEDPDRPSADDYMEVYDYLDDNAYPGIANDNWLLVSEEIATNIANIFHKTNIHYDLKGTDCIHPQIFALCCIQFIYYHSEDSLNLQNNIVDSQKGYNFIKTNLYSLFNTGGGSKIDENVYSIRDLRLLIKEIGPADVMTTGDSGPAGAAAPPEEPESTKRWTSGLSLLLNVNQIRSFSETFKREVWDEVIYSPPGGNLKEFMKHYEMFNMMIDIDPGQDVMKYDALEECLAWYDNVSPENMNKGREPYGPYGMMFKEMMAQIIVKGPEEAAMAAGIAAGTKQLGKIKSIRNAKASTLKKTRKIKNKRLKKIMSKAVKGGRWHTVLLTVLVMGALAWADPFNKFDRKKILALFEKMMEKAFEFARIQASEAKALKEVLILELPEPLPGEAPIPGMDPTPPVSISNKTSDEDEEEIDVMEYYGADWDEEVSWEFTPAQTKEVLNDYFAAMNELRKEVEQAVSETFHWSRAVEEKKKEDEEQGLTAAGGTVECRTFLERNDLVTSYRDLVSAIFDEVSALKNEDFSGSINSDNFEDFANALHAMKKQCLTMFDQMIGRPTGADTSIMLREKNIKPQQAIEAYILKEAQVTLTPKDVSEAIIRFYKECEEKLGDDFQKFQVSNINNVANQVSNTINFYKMKSFIKEDLDYLNFDEKELNDLYKRVQSYNTQYIMKQDYVKFREDVLSQREFKQEWWNSTYDNRHGSVLKGQIDKTIHFAAGNADNSNINLDYYILGTAFAFGADSWILKSNCRGSIVRDLGNNPAGAMHDMFFRNQGFGDIYGGDWGATTNSKSIGTVYNLDPGGGRKERTTRIHAGYKNRVGGTTSAADAQQSTFFDLIRRKLETNTTSWQDITDSAFGSNQFSVSSVGDPRTSRGDLDVIVELINHTNQGGSGGGIPGAVTSAPTLDHPDLILKAIRLSRKSTGLQDLFSRAWGNARRFQVIIDEVLSNDKVDEKDILKFFGEHGVAYSIKTIKNKKVTKSARSPFYFSPTRKTSKGVSARDLQRKFYNAHKDKIKKHQYYIDQYLINVNMLIQIDQFLAGRL